MDNQIGKLEEELRNGGFSNSESPLFDLADDRVKSAYQRLEKETEPEAISRDTSSWSEIQDCVEAHVSQYGDGSLVIISGAAPHIWGAIPYLEQNAGARYVSATSHKLGIDLVASKDIAISMDKDDEHDKEQKALEAIQVQMGRDLGVVKSLGYDSIEEYVADRSAVQNPKNLIVGAEETELHGLYFGEREDQLYTALLNFLKGSKVTSILYIGEDLHVENMRQSFRDGKSEVMGVLPRDKVFDYAKDQGIPVEFGAFGHRDRQDLRNFGLSESIGLKGLSEPHYNFKHLFD